MIKSLDGARSRLAASVIAVACLCSAQYAAAYTPAVYFGNAIETPPDINQPAYDAWIGHSDTWGEAFIPHETWANIENPDWMLSPWGKWNIAHPDRGIFLGVPIFAEPDMGNYAAGASGAYNGHFRVLAEKIVASGLKHVILRPGWEFNGGWKPWGAVNDPAQFNQYWKNIVTTMRSVPGASKIVTFCWNPNIGEPLDLTKTWPGREYVDYIGVDSYDQNWSGIYTKGEQPDAGAQQRAWQDYRARKWGLDWFVSFAKEQRRPLVVPEWGTWAIGDRPTGGDNPSYIQNMHDWIVNNNIAYECYFDVVAGDGDHRLWPGADGKYTTAFPKSTAKYLETFGSARK